MSVAEALMFGYLIRVKIVNASVLELPKYVAEYTALKRKITVYERSWHQIEQAPNAIIMKPKG